MADDDDDDTGLVDSSQRSIHFKSKLSLMAAEESATSTFKILGPMTNDDDDEEEDDGVERRSFDSSGCFLSEEDTTPRGDDKEEEDETSETRRRLTNFRSFRFKWFFSSSSSLDEEDEDSLGSSLRKMVETNRLFWVMGGRVTTGIRPDSSSRWRMMHSPTGSAIWSFSSLGTVLCLRRQNIVNGEE